MNRGGLERMEAEPHHSLASLKARPRPRPGTHTSSDSRFNEFNATSNLYENFKKIRKQVSEKNNNLLMKSYEWLVMVGVCCYD